MYIFRTKKIKQAHSTKQKNAKRLNIFLSKKLQISVTSSYYPCNILNSTERLRTMTNAKTKQKVKTANCFPLHSRLIMLTLSATVIAATPATAFAETATQNSKATEATVRQDSVPLMYKGAGTDMTLLGVLPPGCTVEKYGTLGKWTRIKVNGYEGWIKTEFLNAGSVQDQSADGNTNAVIVNADCLNIRSGESTDTSIIGSLQNGDVLPIVGSKNGWLEIKTKNGKGYIKEEYTSPIAENSFMPIQDFENLYGTLPEEKTDKKASLEKEVLEDVQPAVTAEETQISVQSQENYAPVYETADTSDYYQEYTYTEPTDAVVYEPDYSAESVVSETEYSEENAVQEATPEYTEEIAYEPVETEYIGEPQPETATEEINPYEVAEEADAVQIEDTQEVYDAAAETENTYRTTDISDSDLDLLAAIIQCEAGGESREGKVAVGACVLNRMDSESFPDTMEDVIYQSGQFTPAMTGGLDAVLAEGAREDCYEAAEAALSGENPIGNLLYFHAGGGDGLTIGNQTFY